MGEIRAQQATLVADQMAHVAAGTPAVMLGDFNATPEPYDAIEEPLCYRALSNHPMNLKSAYAVSLGGEEPPCTTWKRRPTGEICRVTDYIFFSAESLEPTGILGIPTEEGMPYERLPTFAYGSDHFALAAGLRFLEKK